MQNLQNQCTFCRRALRLVGVAAANLRAASGNGRLVTEGPAWNRCTVDVIAAARAHCQLALHEAFVEVRRCALLLCRAVLFISTTILCRYCSIHLGLCGMCAPGSRAQTP